MTDLEIRVRANLTLARKEGTDVVKRETLTMILSALKNKQVEKRGDLTDAEEQAVLSTMLKQRQDSFDQFTDAGRFDLAEREGHEKIIISTYMPRPVSDEELRAIVHECKVGMQSLGVVLTSKSLGELIKVTKDELEDRSVRADGRKLAEAARMELQS